MVRGKRIVGLVGIGLLGGFGFLALQNDRAAKKAEHDHPPIGEFVQVEGVRLHYLRKGSGPAVVLIHGNPGSIEDWTLAVIPELASTHHVIAFDRPGHGYSDPAPKDSGSPLVQARLIRRALSKLDVERPILVGHSWGGALILAYALEHAEQTGGLVAVQPTCYPEPIQIDPIYPLLAMPGVGEVFAAALSAPLGRAKVRGKLAIAFSPDPIPQPYLERATAMWTRPNEARATAIDSIRRKEVLENVSPLYREIRAPLIILSGERDQLTDPRGHAHRLHREVPGSQLIAIEGAGHQLPETRAEQVIDAIRRLTQRS
jgi:pimeloyl-ACP methyl ester carboxylesterase